MNDISLKFLKVVDALIEEKNINKAADSLGTSVSSVSYSLKELRRITGSNLFNRVGKMMVPNDSALALQERYKKISEHLYDADQGQGDLKRRGIVISTYSLMEFYLGIKLYNTRIGDDSPCVRFTIPDVRDEERLKKIRNREVDIDIGVKLPEDNSVAAIPYFESKLKVFVSRNHPSIKDTFTIEDWLKTPHAKWTSAEQVLSKQLDAFCDLNLLLQKRIVRYESRNLMNLILNCSYSNNILLLPSVFEESLLGLFPLKSFSLPENYEFEFECYAHYNRSMYTREEVLSFLVKFD